MNTIKNIHLLFFYKQDPKRSGHRGFGFVTFAENGVADRVARRSHEICGQEVAIDSATPLDEAAGPSGAGGGGGSSSSRPEHFGGYAGGGPMRTFGRMYGGGMSLDDVSQHSTNLNIIHLYPKI